MALANVIVIKIMGRGNLYATGSFFHVSVVVGKDWNQSAYQRKGHKFPNKIAVSWVFGIYGYASIAQQRFWSRSRDDDVVFAIQRFDSFG